MLKNKSKPTDSTRCSQAVYLARAVYTIYFSVLKISFWHTWLFLSGIHGCRPDLHPHAGRVRAGVLYCELSSLATLVGGWVNKISLQPERGVHIRNSIQTRQTICIMHQPRASQLRTSGGGLCSCQLRLQETASGRLGVWQTRIDWPYVACQKQS